MARALKYWAILVLAVCCYGTPAFAVVTSPAVAIFPFQELGEGRNDANLPFTRVLAGRLTEKGTRIIGVDTVIAFMANNRIRTLGRLETLRIGEAENDLGAAFVLVGTVDQRKERPEPTLGVTLNLVRTSDARTIWSFTTSLSTGEDRKILGIGEPQSTAELQPLVIDEILKHWPYQRINEVQQVGAINIESVALSPRYVRPGEEVHGQVRLRNTWAAGHAPRIFFKAADQLYPAKLSADGTTYEGTWVAGEENGRYSVHLFLEWSLYGRTESALLGSYLVDGTPPVLDLSLRGAKILDGIPVVNQKVAILPQLLVRKPLSRWRLAFYYESGNLAGDMDGAGDLPKSFIWSGRGNFGRLEDGDYDIVVEAWDKAGNLAKASKRVRLDRSIPKVEMAVNQTAEGMVVGLNQESRIPLSYWRMEMWTREGKLLTETEGKDLPAKIKVDLSNSVEEKDLRGIVVFEDVLGNQVRKKVEDLLPKLVEAAKAKAKAEAEKKKPKGISERWVDEF